MCTDNRSESDGYQEGAAAMLTPKQVCWPAGQQASAPVKESWLHVAPSGHILPPHCTTQVPVEGSQALYSEPQQAPPQ